MPQYYTLIKENLWFGLHLEDYWKTRLGDNFVEDMLTEGFSTDEAARFAADLIHEAAKSETPIT